MKNETKDEIVRVYNWSGNIELPGTLIVPAELSFMQLVINRIKGMFPKIFPKPIRLPAVREYTITSNKYMNERKGQTEV